MQLVPIREVSKFAVEPTKPSEQGRVVPKSKLSFRLPLSISSKPVVSAVLPGKSGNLEQGPIPEMWPHDSAEKDHVG